MHAMDSNNMFTYIYIYNIYCIYIERDIILLYGTVCTIGMHHPFTAR